jgi:hypothetical protein
VCVEEFPIRIGVRKVVDFAVFGTRILYLGHLGESRFCQLFWLNYLYLRHLGASRVFNYSENFVTCT